jgi:regulator of sirC expression with transglutaminase-like and TPR domain
VRRQLRGLSVATIEEMIALPAAEIDVARAALLVARRDRPEVDVPAALALIDAMAAEVRSAMERSPGVPARDALAAFLGSRFSADRDDPEGHSIENLHLDRVLERRKGYCVTLSVLGFALAERLAIEIRGVRTPYHYWLRVDGRNLETTNQGAELPDEHYRGRAGQSAKSPIYLRPLEPHTVVADLLSNSGALAYRRGELDTALGDLDLALEVDPTLAFAWHNRAVVHHARGELAAALADAGQAVELDPWSREHRLLRASLRRATGDSRGAAEDMLQIR